MFDGTGGWANPFAAARPIDAGQDCDRFGKKKGVRGKKETFTKVAFVLRMETNGLPSA